MARRNIGLAAALAVLLALAALLGSCSQRLGWGVVLWSAPEGPISAGAIVPVYIKSNIQRVYVVGVPGSGKKIELPFWQVELYSSRGKASARVKAMGENVGLYMVAVRDGLPLRDKPANDAKRVYRLREGQSVKILEKAEGEAVTTGGKSLPGTWYLVLADDGSSGYAFSYAFRVYDESKEGPPVLASAKKAALSGRADLIFSRSWRPEYFQEMIDDDRVDLDYFSLRYGLFIDAIRRQVRLELPGASKVFGYSDVSEDKGLYVFEGTPLRIKIESDSRLLCSWSGEAPPAGQPASEADANAAAPASDAPAAAAGAPGADAPTPAAAPAASVNVSAAAEDYASAGAGGSAVFVVLSSEPQEAIRAESLRQQKLLSAFVDQVGGEWGSVASGTGRLSIAKNGRFGWVGRGEAAAALLPEGAGSTGEIAFRLFADPSLAPDWEGALSLRFDPSAAFSAPSSSRALKRWVDFLYRRSPAGLVLAKAAPSAALVVRAPDGRSDPLVLEAVK